MTAGRGIVHSEMPKVTTGDLHGFQLWINLPKKDKMCKPRYVGQLELADGRCKNSSWFCTPLLCGTA